MGNAIFRLGVFSLLAPLSGAPPKGNIDRKTFPVRTGDSYELLVSSPSLSTLSNAPVQVKFSAPGGTSIHKTLHAGDADFYMPVKFQHDGEAVIELSPPSAVDIQFTPLKSLESATAQIASGLHTTWQTAQPIHLERPIFASADDRPYVPEPGAGPDATFQQMLAGVHWYTFQYQGPGDKLVHLNLDVIDRDVPVDIALFTLQNGQPAEYTRGRERYEPEKSTNYHGLQKFLARVISPGTYYLRVMGNHPYYRLESDLYAAPPYKDPRLAVRTAMDFLVRRGDSWHSNIPRKGMVALRTSQTLQETRLCIACHQTHFTTRGELMAVENGYPVKARASLQYLMERLYNNPRPIYGRTDASWARMIHAPGNVLSRLAWLTSEYEREFRSERRDELYRGIAGYLEMYWPGMKEPQPESNGNLPRISGYEVAIHNGLLFGDLYQRTGLEKYRGLREQIEQVATAGEPADILDLSWKLDALVTFGREKYAAQIGEIRDKLFEYQKPDGSWAMPFGMEVVEYDWTKREVKVKKLPNLAGSGGPRASEFQTYHTMYALARAGITAADPRMRKAIDFCLSRQQPSGAWQGAPDYKNFDTPYRDTQYAIMALSTLFPGPLPRGGGAYGWSAGRPTPPSHITLDNPLQAISDLDQHWDRPSEDTAARIRTGLRSNHVLVRQQAAAALGRFADANSISALALALGDPSKLVQRTAAWSLRQIASRRMDARPQLKAALTAALDSSNERVRWGALRVFNQHFKYVSEDWDFGQRLIRIASSDSVPFLKMAAAQSLYQWWYWDRSLDHKAAIEDALIAGLGREEHPWVRRNFIEAYYNVLDDNVRYLYGSWIVRVKKQEDKDAIVNGHHLSVRNQAQRYLDAMRNGNARTRDGLLRALYTHHIREGLGDIRVLAKAAVPPTAAGAWVNGYKWASIYDPVTGGSGAVVSIGNDSEAPVFYDDSAPLMNEAFRVALDKDTDATPVLRALKFLRTFKPDASLTAALLDRVNRQNAAAMKVALASAPLGDPTVSARLAAIASTGSPEAVDVAAALLAQGRIPDAVISAARERLSKVNPADTLFAGLFALAGGPSDFLTQAIASTNPQVRKAALGFVLSNPLLPPNALNDPAVHAEVLALASSMDQRRLRNGREVVLSGLTHSDARVRAAALAALHTMDSLQKDAAVRNSLATLLKDPDALVRNSARTLDASLAAREGRQTIAARDLLDYDYFEKHVEPILVRKGHDGMACANCHANHNIFKLREADEFGVVTRQDSSSNYNAALNVVNVANPENSLILNKPVSPLDDAGIGDSQKFSHGGGLRWQTQKNSEEYRTVLRWIQGARLDNR